MTTVSIDDLVQPVTPDEAKTAIYTGLANVGTTTTSWKPGSVVRTLIAVIGVMYSALTYLVARVAKYSFLDFAEGNWLTEVAYFRHGIGRRGLLTEDPETDAQLLQRCREALLGRGDLTSVYARYARLVKRADGSQINVTRDRLVLDGRGNGYLYLASPDGNVSGSIADLSSDLGLVNDSLQRTIVPLGFTLHTESATPALVSFAYKAFMLDTSGRRPEQVAALIQKALASYLSTMPIGGCVIDGQPGRIYLDDLKGVIKGVLPEIFHVALYPLDDLEHEITANFAIPKFGATRLGTLNGSVYEQQQRVI